MAPLICHVIFMGLEITKLTECLVTFGTGKWPLTGIGLFMGFEITTLTECLVTFGTC